MNHKKMLKLLLLDIGLARYNNNKNKIIYYHDFHSKNEYARSQSTPLSLFKTHLKIIYNNEYKIVKEFSHKYNHLQVHLDDGFRGIYENFDFFVKNRIPVTLFIIPSRLNQRNYLSSEELLELQGSGLVRFGSHTYNHVSLPGLSVKEMEKELKGSRDYLEEKLNQPVTDFCYPRGFFSNKTIEMAMKAGYTHQYSSIPGDWETRFYDELIPRNLVQHAGKREIKLVLKGAGKILQKRYLKQHCRE